MAALTDRDADQLLEMIRKFNGIWTYPNADDNNRRVFAACVELESSGRLVRKRIDDRTEDRSVFFAVPDALPE